MIAIDTRELVSPILIIILAGGVFFVSLGFPESRSGGPGADLYPAFIAVCLFMLGVIQAIQSVVLELPERDGPPLSKQAMKKLAVPVGGLLSFILLLPQLGYLLGTILYLVLFMRYSGITDYRRSIPVSVGISILTQYVFGGILNVQLPEGVVPFARLLPMTFGGLV